jgi:hypothetical protein
MIEQADDLSAMAVNTIAQDHAGAPPSRPKRPWNTPRVIETEVIRRTESGPSAQSDHSPFGGTTHGLS